MNCCEYCGGSGVLRVSKDALVSSDIFVCDDCWKLLHDPKTALPLIRGHLVINLRGIMPKERLDETLNKYMEMLSKWKPKN